jgi:hypothetical protein
MASKPGPRPFKPTGIQRRRIVHGIAIGLTLEELAADLGIPYGTLRRVFANEIKIARVRVRLDNVGRLDRAAAAGNVSAMKALLQMTDRWRPDLEDDEDDDAWTDVVGDSVPNLSRNPEIQNRSGETH